VTDAELLDTATRVYDLAEAAATNAEAGERASTTQERDALRQVARDLASAAQLVANAEEQHARGRSRRDRAASPRLYALREAALHLKQLVEARIVGPAEEGGATARPINLSEVTDAMLRNAADWLTGYASGYHKANEVKLLIGAACVRAYIAERIAQREEGNS